ncbi:HSP70/HSP90 organizing protein HOP [Klebsormidium nitens]|uniref:HSP70/HSP90 organizing protein HOP n=1 Tax=Klebsormidium nitens TaxID=105231 RepID=A0A1Y1HKC2_KLENI|nr:HSP70/HSP90 organizing protein HOP [Klebsormidium nitens]|eukprot:GAQ78393.1 HSP70/HSP90 organizing protein HOP [Klebsormidium nitens]
MAPSADEWKAKGNAAFSAGRYQEGIDAFSEAIKLAPTNHVLYSNRSACYASLKDYDAALADANKTVELKGDWPKGYSRQGSAYMGLQKYDEAIKAFENGLKVDPNNEVLKEGLEDARDQKDQAEGKGGMSGLFSTPEALMKLHSDPRTRAFMSQPDFLQKLAAIQKNPALFNVYLQQDKRIATALSVVLGVDLQMASDDDLGQSEPSPSRRPESKPERKAEEKKAEPEPEPEPEDEDAREKKRRKAEAVKAKEEGNVAYKKKDFDAAIEQYTKAMELDEDDIAYRTNRAAVYLEMGKYDDAIKDCDAAVEKGRELRADYKSIAKALTRKGTAYVKMAKTAKDYDPAIEAFQKALTEHRNPDTLKKLNDAEKAQKQKQQEEYFNPELAEEEREKGNDAFKKMDYPEAIRHYTEALKRNPNDHRIYSNRAACYTKLGAMPEGLKDAEKTIELAPDFVRGYERKGSVQFFMKKYEDALETYQQGLKIDPNNQELQDGIRRCIQQQRRAATGQLSEEELKERQARASQDPEIAGILRDPIMQNVLREMSENPRAAADHQKNPIVWNKVMKLIQAGIVQVQ